jgi:hypothetical protein
MLVGWCSLLKSYRAHGAQFAAALTTSLVMWLVAFLDVGGRVVSDVAVANMEWAGRGIPNVYQLSVWCFWLWCNASQLPISRQPFFFGGYFPLAHDPGVSGIDSQKP